MNEPKQLLEQAIELWNDRDREGWAALYADDVVYEAPGGARITGLADLKEKYFDAYLEAAPDRTSYVDSLICQDNVVVEQGTYGGTHTGTFRGPDGSEIPPTGKTMNVSFAAIFHVTDDKIASIRLYYDQIELLTQLGLMPQPTA